VVHPLREVLAVPGQSAGETAGDSAIYSGKAFRPIKRHDQIASHKALTRQAVTLVLMDTTHRARSADAAKSVAGHSIRAGCCAEAASVGIAAHVIM